MSLRLRNKSSRAVICIALAVCIFSQFLQAFAAEAKVGDEFDFGRLFYSAFKPDDGLSFLEKGGASVNLVGTGNDKQTKSLLMSESAYSSLKAFLPYNFSINYYFFSDGKIRADLKIAETSGLRQAAAVAAEIYSRIITPDMSDEDKVRAIHDYIVLNCEYDYDSMSSYNFPAYSYYGVFMNKKAVCSGYADAFHLLCGMAGIPSMIVCGTATNGSEDVSHAWNMAYINDKWLYIDVTFDDPYPDRKGVVIYDYFLVDYAKISADHSFNEPYYLTLAEYFNSTAEQSAQRLAALGLFKGTGKGFDLYRTPTRAEAAVMLVRLLGKESEALDPLNGYAVIPPFTDMPSWAAGHIGYLYAHGITTGVSKTKFGSDSLISVNQYLTFVLRVLGYHDGTDFVWSDAGRFSQEIGLVSKYKLAAISANSFLRADLADISLAALNQTYKNADTTLYERLLASGALTSDLRLQRLIGE